MKRRTFLSAMPVLALLQACRNSIDDELFVDRKPTQILLTADKNLQEAAEREVASPLRERLSKRYPDADIAFLCIHNLSGDVLAYIPTFRDGAEFDNCRVDTRDIGSTAKPIAIGVALQTNA